MILEPQILSPINKKTFKLPLVEMIYVLAEVEHHWAEHYHRMGKLFYRKEVSGLCDKYYYQSLAFKRKALQLQKRLTPIEIQFDTNIGERLLKLKEGIQALGKQLPKKSPLHFHEIIASLFPLEHSTLEFYQQLEPVKLANDIGVNEILVERIERVKLIKSNSLKMQLL